MLSEDQSLHQELYNEFLILKKTAKKDLENIVSLERVVMTFYHVGFQMQTYSMTLADWIKSGDPHFNKVEIINQLWDGLIQLHELGWVHRDLKPENIVIQHFPFEIRLIDFNRAVPTSDKRIGTEFGTPGYFPQKAS